MAKLSSKHQLAQYRGHLQECLAVLEALATAAASRDYYRIHIKNHAEPASGLAVTDIVRRHGIEKIRTVLGN